MRNKSAKDTGSDAPPKYWIGVVSRDHVAQGVKAGIAQIGHGKRAGLARMKQGDWLIYYSPRISLQSGEKLQAFTAIGQMADNDIYQVEISPLFKPFRRRMQYKRSKEVQAIDLVPELSFIKNKAKWGYVFRFGLIEIPLKDFQLISNLMLR